MASRSVEAQMFNHWLQGQASLSRSGVADSSGASGSRWTTEVTADRSQEYNILLERMREQIADAYEPGMEIAWSQTVFVLRIVEQSSGTPEVRHFDINICHFGLMENIALHRNLSSFPPDRQSHLSSIDAALFSYLSMPEPEPEAFNSFMWDSEKTVHVFRAPVKNKIAGSERYANSWNETATISHLGHFNEVLDAANASRTDNMAAEILQYLAAMLHFVREKGDPEDNRIFDLLMEFLSDRLRPKARTTGQFKSNSMCAGGNFKTLWVYRSAYGELHRDDDSLSQKSQMVGLFDEFIPPGGNREDIMMQIDANSDDGWRIGAATVDVTDPADATPLLWDGSMEVPNDEYFNPNIISIDADRPSRVRTGGFRQSIIALEAIEADVIEAQDCRAAAFAYLAMCNDRRGSRELVADCGEVQYSLDTFREAEGEMHNAPASVQRWVREVLELLELLWQMRNVLEETRRQGLPDSFATQGVDSSGWGNYNGQDIQQTKVTITKPNVNALYLPNSVDRTGHFEHGSYTYNLSLSRSGELRVATVKRIMDVIKEARPTGVQVGPPFVTASWSFKARGQDPLQWTRTANKILSGRYGHKAALWFMGLVSGGEISLSSASTNCCYMRSTTDGRVEGTVSEAMSKELASQLAYIYSTVTEKLYWTEDQRTRPEVYEVNYDGGAGFHFQHVQRVDGDLDSYQRVGCRFRRSVG